MSEEIVPIDMTKSHVMCPICSKLFKKLPVHLNRVHGIENPTKWAEENRCKLYPDEPTVPVRSIDPTKQARISYGNPLKYITSAQKVFNYSIDSLEKGEVSPNQEIALTRAIIHAILRQIEDKYIKSEVFEQVKQTWISVLRNNTDRWTIGESIEELEKCESLLELTLTVLRHLSPGSTDEIDVSDLGDLATAASRTGLLEWLSALSRFEETKVRIDERLALSEVRRFGQQLVLSIVNVLDQKASTCPHCSGNLDKVRHGLLLELRQVALRNGIPL